jgi:hypothetical protein
MKHQNFATPPIQLLRSGKGTPTSSAAHAVDAAVRSAADSDLLHAVDSAVGRVFYSAVYQPVYIRTWNAIFATWRTKREIHFKHKAAVLETREASDAPNAPKAVAPGKRGEPQPWGFTIALLMVGSLFALAFAQSYRPARKVMANSPTPVPSATPDLLANVPATGKIIENGRGYWQWDGQQWKPVPRAIPVGR